jgi:hypothetical protein
VAMQAAHWSGGTMSDCSCSITPPHHRRRSGGWCS